MNETEWIGGAAVSAMLLCWALEDRSRHFVLGFALSCLAACGYATAIGSWPFAAVELLWSALALRRWWRTRPARPSAQVRGERAMTTDAFCTLSPDELTGRLDWIRREIAPHAQRRVALEGGIAWEFDASPDTRTRLERLARLEGACCGPSGLEFTVRAPREDALRFEIVGPNAAAVARAFESGDVALAPPAAVRNRGRFARIAGAATLGALFVCCALPIAVAAVAGAAIAAPLLRLEHPLALAGVGLACGYGMWRRERRRATARPGEPATGGCGC